jgi:hypothetical protein
MTLGDWQNRLQQNFGALRRQRTAAVGEKPVFALEHGLNSDEFTELSGLIRAHINTSFPDEEHSLTWVVYAAELGYRYSGDEYWQTFEEETPGWNIRGDRHWIRECYRAFHREYGAAKPSGPWAEQFSIICWPITHAILPRDLQRQLARILFELRHSFSADLFESPTKLGDFIAARSWNATSRFQNLAEEPQLLGQIAAALLLQGAFGTHDLIHRDTLRRIGDDLDRERRGRDWLRAAQKFARERAHIRGLAFGRAGSRAIERPDEARAEVAALGIEPRLILRPADAAGDQWEVSLEIPDLSSLLFRFPSVRDALTGSRCVVAGAAGRPLARERCLHGDQRVVLNRWPKSDEVLLKFERDDRQLDYLLRTECLLRPGPNWLFRIASDGLAYERRSLRVRAGERYILATTGAPLSPGDHVRVVDFSCRGVSGVLIDVPATIDMDLEDRLRRLGLSPAKNIEVWPAGLAAVAWDGEGHGEWLASERACLGLRSDHPIASLFISMSSGLDVPLELTAIGAGEVVFVELPQLSVGLHKVRVSTRDQLGHIEPLGDLDVVMRIREARPWSPSANQHGPLLVQVDPLNPSLEQLWEGRVELSLAGPRGRQLRCRISLYETDGGAPIASVQMPPLSLPVSQEAWARHFQQHFQKKPEVQGSYDSTRICALEFTADELGSFSLRCRRDLTPLRWAVRRTAGQQTVRLIDDSGNAGAPKLNRYSCERPDRAEQLDSASLYTVPDAGGLYVAQHDDVLASVVVPPAVRTLADLRCVPVFDKSERSIESVLRLARMFRLWAHARLPGDLLSTMRQQTVLQAVIVELFRIIGGDAWARAEATAGGTVSELAHYVSRRGEDSGFIGALETDLPLLRSADCNERVRHLTALAQRWRLVRVETSRVGSGSSPAPTSIDEGGVRSLVELALRFASNPGNLDHADKNLKENVLRLISTPTLARAARFVVVGIDRQQHSPHATPGEAYLGWSWL